MRGRPNAPVAAARRRPARRSGALTLARTHATTPLHAPLSVLVPASTSNLGAGFDCVGVAVDRWLRVTARAGESGGEVPRITRAGTVAALAEPPERDAIWTGLRAACDARGAPAPRGLVLDVDSTIPVGRGLGSSAAALVAGAAVADAMLDLGLGAAGIAELCTRLEGHPDNAVPCVYGGAMLAVMRDGQPLAIAALAVHPDVAFVFAIPAFATETKAARAALPADVPHAVAVQGAARAAALVHGLATAHAAMLAAALDDVLHVPYRRALVRGYDAVVDAAVRAGAHGATLSGAGSGLVALAPAPLAAAVAAAMAGAWRALGVDAETLVHTRPVRGYHVEHPTARRVPGRDGDDPPGR